MAMGPSGFQTETSTRENSEPDKLMETVFSTIKMVTCTKAKSRTIKQMVKERLGRRMASFSLGNGLMTSKKERV